jgi:hypothetical protein
MEARDERYGDLVDDLAGERVDEPGLSCCGVQGGEFTGLIVLSAQSAQTP